MDDDRDRAEEFDAVVAEVNNVVTGILGYALLMARDHRPEIEDILKREAARYVKLVERLRRIRRGEE